MRRGCDFRLRGRHFRFGQPFDLDEPKVAGRDLAASSPSTANQNRLTSELPIFKEND